MKSQKLLFTLTQFICGASLLCNHKTPFSLHFSCISFPTVYLYGGELFPTVIRNIAIGTASMIARIGSMIAPFVATELNGIAYWLPPFIFGITPILGAVLVLFLPGESTSVKYEPEIIFSPIETRGFPLPETIEDGENFGKKQPKKQTA